MPTLLFKKGSNGKIIQWRNWVIGAELQTEHGQVGGKLQLTSEVFFAGKNIAKSNATTAEEQAELEAQARWTKKKKSGYVVSLTEARAGGRDVVIQGGVDPMLAQSYSKHAAKIKWPAYSQPKLDGIRCLALLTEKGDVTLWSRTRKPIKSMPHVIKALKGLHVKAGTVLDGELYSHAAWNAVADEAEDSESAHKVLFEKITSLVRPLEPVPGHEIMEYHVYDMCVDLPFEQRHWNLARLLRKATLPLVLVETLHCESEPDGVSHYGDCLTRGYEGAMFRNADSTYEFGKRSYSLQKVKQFDDAEYEITGVMEGRGKLAGCAGSMECRLPNGGVFNVKMKGSFERLREFFQHPPVGKLLTVQYQNLTAAGVPRFPIGLKILQDKDY